MQLMRMGKGGRSKQFKQGIELLNKVRMQLCGLQQLAAPEWAAPEWRPAASWMCTACQTACLSQQCPAEMRCWDSPQGLRLQLRSQPTRCLSPGKRLLA